MVPDTELPIPWNFLGDWNIFWFNEKTLGGLLADVKMKVGCQENQPRLEFPEGGVLREDRETLRLFSSIFPHVSSNCIGMFICILYDILYGTVVSMWKCFPEFCELLWQIITNLKRSTFVTVGWRQWKNNLGLATNIWSERLSCVTKFST